MEVREVKCHEQALWDGFVGSHPEATCFHWWGWRRPISEVLGYRTPFLGAFERGRLIGVLPLALVSSSFFGRSSVSLPFCSYGGPLTLHPEAEQMLVARGIELAHESGSKYLELRQLHARQDGWPSQDVYVTFRKELPVTLDEQMSFIPSKRRNMIRRALKEGLVCKVGRDVEAFFPLYQLNARAHGTPALPKRFFEVLMDGLGDKADILFVCNSRAKPISAILNFYIAQEIHAGFAGEDPSARSIAANDLKYWALMQHAVGRGCRIFDFGRSKVGTGSYAFKRLWGFEPKALKYCYPYLPSGAVPQNNPNNANFKLAIAVWRRLPLWVVDFVGPRIIHGLG